MGDIMLLVLLALFWLVVAFGAGTLFGYHLAKEDALFEADNNKIEEGLKKINDSEEVIELQDGTIEVPEQ